jgi:hypothetical protein
LFVNAAHISTESDLREENAFPYRYAFNAGQMQHSGWRVTLVMYYILFCVADVMLSAALGFIPGALIAVVLEPWFPGQKNALLSAGTAGASVLIYGALVISSHRLAMREVRRGKQMYGIK